jgi:diacylglycerol O-acyltransferase / wax synthase
MVNVLISNVPGPRKPMYCAGARLENYFPVSIPSHGALNITVQNYMDNLDFGLIACRAAVPDIQRMSDMLVEEFETLKQAAGLLEEAS